MRIPVLVLASLLVACGSGSSGGANDDVTPVQVAPGPAGGSGGASASGGGASNSGGNATSGGGTHGGGTSSGGAGGPSSGGAGGANGGGTTAGGASSGGSTAAGGAANGGASAGGGSSTGGACGDWSASVCHYAYACEPPVMALFFGSEAECRVEYTRYCEINRALAGAAQTDAQLEACAQAGANVTDCYHQDVLPACDFAGTSPDGTACQSDWQCQSGNCRTKSGTACGTCETLAPGAPCSSSASCDAGYFCAQNGTCTEIGSLGASCTTDDECILTLVCTNGSCSVPPDMGEPCTTKCNLAKSLTCDDKSKTCVPDTTTVAMDGQPCAVDPTTNAYTFCDGTSWCDIPSGAQTGTCKPRIGEGAACTKSLECEYPLLCVNGACHGDFMCP